MDDFDECIGAPDNPLGRVLFDKDKFIDYFITSRKSALECMKEESKHGNLAEESGSRLHSWRVLLGLIPSESNPEAWVSKIRQHRARFYKISERYSIEKTKDLDPMSFNPLMASKNNLWSEMIEDKDMKDTIMKDVVRTYQEYKFFQIKEVKDRMVSTLYFWAKTYPMYSYRQGMNEIIAVIYFVLASEKSGSYGKIDQLSDSEIASDNEKLIKFLYNKKHMDADVFVIFEKVMSMGIKELYGTIEDLTSIKGKLDSCAKDNNDRMFKWKYEIEQEEKGRRAKIEQIYDEERKKSAVMRRCNRIYHNYLKRVDTEVYKHLVSIRLDPELQLMRWLRCILSREFNIDMTLSLWDYIFSGIKDEYREDRDFGDMYYAESYFDSTEDPLINLDYLCLAMIENIRDKIYKQEIEDCLEVFFNYPEVKGASRLISVSEEKLKKLKSGTKIQSSSGSLKSKDNNLKDDLEEAKASSTEESTFFSKSDLKEDKIEEEKKETVSEKPAKRDVSTKKSDMFYDPLSNFNSKSKFPSRGIPAAKPKKNEEEEEGFVSKRISDMRTPSDDSSTQNTRSHHHTTYEKDDDNCHDYGSHHHSMSKNITGEKVIGSIMGGWNMINQKRKEYVDPLVKKGLNSVQSQINKRNTNNTEDLQQNRVLKEKLCKVSDFLKKLRDGSSYEVAKRQLINVDVEEEELSDIQAEIETMIQMTSSHSNDD
ncbi:unnamed protein product [Moneuplotes crassus]|uniref:Rab-GAP TBC domain-containing protein n=1 Tax=Euplotes crassus TaxID=5936 RepID=A0AAD1U4Z6_EUPCR|nr:unnamed protein product [Moneuplotes crassus]